MPKASKKSKDKHADFSKAKLKLGKGKKIPSNATNTSFKARSIALPGQHVLNRALLAEGSDEPHTAQGLNLDEILVRLRHPNASVRKETLGGLKEVVVAGGPEREAGKVVRAIGGILADEDASVRKATLGFLAWYLPLLNETVLIPHLPLLLLQTSSSLSHIFPEIRLDACRLVNLLLENYPSHVVGSWPRGSSTILEGLRLSLGVGDGAGVGGGTGKIGMGGRVVVLRALRGFLECALRADTNGDDALWGLNRRDASKGKGKEREVGQEGVMEGWKDEGYLEGSNDWALEALDASWELGRLDGSSTTGGDHTTVDILAQLYLQLQPLLQSTFLESAPTAFSPASSSALPSSDDVPLSLCVTSASLTYLLAKSVLTQGRQSTSQVREGVSDFLRRMAPYFPFHTKHQTSPSGISPAFELSLIYANLAILLAPRYEAPAIKTAASISSTSKGGWRARIRATEEAWASMRGSHKGKGRVGADTWALEEIAEWVVSVLSPNKDVLAPSLTPTAYTALLSIIHSLLLQPPPPPQSTAPNIPATTTSSFLTHLLRHSPTSQTRSKGDTFLIDLILIHEDRYQSPESPPVFIPLGSEVRGLVKVWVEGLGKALWEIGVKDWSGTDRILRFLLILGQRGERGFERPYSLVDPAAFTGIATRLTPFFYLSHPTKGDLPGPWGRLGSVKLQKLALDVARVWREWDVDESLGNSVVKAVRSEGWAKTYWIESPRSL